MDCYRCNTKMKKDVLDGILIDKCDNCLGVWLDAGELKMLILGDGKDDEDLISEAKYEIKQEKGRLLSVKGLCPSCQNESLISYNRSGIELDRCDNCKGIFFDGKELEQILSKEKGESKHLIKKLFKSFFK